MFWGTEQTSAWRYYMKHIPFRGLINSIERYRKALSSILLRKKQLYPSPIVCAKLDMVSILFIHPFKLVASLQYWYSCESLPSKLAAAAYHYRLPSLEDKSKAFQRPKTSAKTICYSTETHSKSFKQLQLPRPSICWRSTRKKKENKKNKRPSRLRFVRSHRLTKGHSSLRVQNATRATWPAANQIDRRNLDVAPKKKRKETWKSTKKEGGLCSSIISSNKSQKGDLKTLD